MLNNTGLSSTDDANKSESEAHHPSEVDSIPQPPTAARKLTQEVVDMIFTQFLAKPAVHFAEIRYKTPGGDADFYLPNGGLAVVSLHEWNSCDIKSGYVSAGVLNGTSKSARDVVRRATTASSNIVYNSRIVQADASTDLLCLVIPQMCVPRRQRQGRMSAKFGGIPQAGILVTPGMWNGLLSDWFLPGQCDGWRPHDYRQTDGRLFSYYIAEWIQYFAGIKTFYFILTDITDEDWVEYYQNFPVAYHDANGSYVQVREQPIHVDLITDLVGQDTMHFLKHPHDSKQDINRTKPVINPDGLFPDRLNAQMDCKFRCRLLLGLLQRSMPLAWGARIPQCDPEFAILVRRPVWLTDNTVPKLHRPPRPIADNVQVDWENIEAAVPEDVWAKIVLDAVASRSDEAYQYYSAKDAGHNQQTGFG